MSSALMTDYQHMLRSIGRVAPQTDNLEFAAVVRTARRKRGLTQRGLAALLDVSPATVAHWERGSTRPNIDARIDLAKVLGVPFDQLLPEADGVNQVVVTDPILIKIVQMLERLSPSDRQSYLAIVAISQRANPHRQD